MPDPYVTDFQNEAPMPRMWVFVSRDAKGKEGICSAALGGQHFPMITGTERTMQMMEKYAQQLRRLTGKQIFIVEYTRSHDVREIAP